MPPVLQGQAPQGVRSAIACNLTEEAIVQAAGSHRPPSAQESSRVWTLCDSLPGSSQEQAPVNEVVGVGVQRMTVRPATDCV